MVIVNKLLLSLGVAGLITGCGGKSSGGGGGNPVAAVEEETSSVATTVDNAIVIATDSELVLPNKLALIPPSSGGAGLRLADIDDDRTEVFVEEASLENLAQAEAIMCYIGQTRPEMFVNAGQYVALVNESLCRDDGNRGGGGSNNEQSIITMIVEVTREAERPLTARGWVTDIGEEGVEIQFTLAVASGPTAANPLGIFRMNWDEKYLATSVGGGLIESSIPETEGQIALRFFEEQAQPDRTRVGGATALLSASDTGELSGKVTTFNEGSESYNGETFSYALDYLVAFDSNLIRADGTVDGAAQARCLSRSDFNSKVYRYGLYNVDGSRVELNSGFPIEFDYNGATRSGHASFWGVWTEGDITLSDGDSVRRVEWVDGQKQTSDYTISKAPGKLFKYTAKTITLNELQGVDLEYWDNQTNEQYVVQFNGTSFEKVSKKTYQNDGPPLIVGASGPVGANDWGSYNFYVNGLSAGISFNAQDFAANGGNLTVKYHKQTLVSGTANVPSGNLVCVAECVKIPMADSDFDSQSENGPYLTVSTNWGTTRWPENVASPLATYRFDATNNVLELTNGTEFALPSGVDRDSAGQFAYVSTGMLIPESVYNATPNKSNISPWDYENLLDEFYRWESGFDPWSQFVSVKDANGNYAQFDQPLRFSYTHTQANDYDNNANNPAVGKKFEIEYGGFGELWGIPWNPVPGTQEWAPDFSIASGTTLGDYTIKALTVAQQPAAAADCSALSLADPLPKTTSADRTPVDNGTMPDKTILQTRVISGEIQD